MPSDNFGSYSKAAHKERLCFQKRTYFTDTNKSIVWFLLYGISYVNKFAGQISNLCSYIATPHLLLAEVAEGVRLEDIRATTGVPFQAKSELCLLCVTVHAGC